MNRLSPRVRITIGLLGLLVSVMLLALVLRIVPDRGEAVLAGRSRLCEAMAVNTSVLVSREDVKRLQAILTVLIRRHDDMHSAAVRSPDGELLVEIGEHTEHWTELVGEYSTESQVLVPLNSGGEDWALEVRFEPLHGSAWQEILFNPWVRLVGFVAGVCGVMWYMYLGKVLDQLNPSQAVPGRVRNALDTLAEGLLVLDRKGRIVLCNTSLADILGRDCDEMTGVPAGSLAWCGADQNDPEFPWQRVLDAPAGTSTHASETLVLPDYTGAPRIFKANCSPVLGANDETRGVVCSFEDITELESQKVELAASKVAAETANQAKSQFLANMSHEIRTPLNAILGFADVLRRGMFENDAQRTEYLNTIHSSGHHLLHLINDILDLSKVEAGHLEIETVSCSPHQLILDVISVLRVKSDEKKLTLSASTPGGLPETIQTDSSRLRQIMTNIIGNAIKFTQDGGVSVVARTLQGPVSQLQIDITDTGVGISEDAQCRIFDPFSQADGSITRRFGGTGLGLTISKQFAEAMGGKLAVTSTEGKGSTFTVVIGTGEIPSDMAMLDISQFEQTTPIALGDESDTKFEFGVSRILLVDDGEANRRLIELVLKRNGLSVDTATNGQEAVELASEFEYDLILMDMQMPVMDGYTATETLREQGLEIPIVALTANAMRGDEEKCLNAGCSEFLTKPVNLDKLLACVATLLGAAPKRGDKGGTVFEQGNGSLSNTAGDRPLLASESPSIQDTDDVLEEGFEIAEMPSSTMSQTDLLELLHSGQSDQNTPVFAAPVRDAAPRPAATGAAIRSNLPFDDAEFRDIVNGFVEKLKSEVAAMEEAWSQHDLDEMARLAHWLKGAAGTMGFGQFTEPGTRLMEVIEEGHAERIEPVLQQIVELAASVDAPQSALVGCE